MKIVVCPSAFSYIRPCESLVELDYVLKSPETRQSDVERLLERRIEALQQTTREGSMAEKREAALVCSRVHFTISVLLVPDKSFDPDVPTVILAIEHLDRCILLSGPLNVYLDRVAMLEEQFTTHIYCHNQRWAIVPAPPLPCSKLGASSSFHLPEVLLDMSFEQYVSMRHRPFVCQGWYKNCKMLLLSDVFQYLASKFGHRLVPVEIGVSYMDSDWKPDVIALGQVIQQIRSGPLDSGSIYLAQHEMFDQIPELKKLLFFPPFICDEEQCIVNIWLGPAGTTSPLHTDPYDNVLVQVYGRKVVYLVDPAFSDRITLGNNNALSGNTSIWTVQTIEQAVPCMRTEIQPGDALYIPRGWWHMVVSTSESVSVSFWHFAER